jgi:hypothetical protein
MQGDHVSYAIKAEISGYRVPVNGFGGKRGLFGTNGFGGNFAARGYSQRINAHIATCI